jgi:hypothetical protein
MGVIRQLPVRQETLALSEALRGVPTHAADSPPSGSAAPAGGVNGSVNGVSTGGVNGGVNGVSTGGVNGGVNGVSTGGVNGVPAPPVGRSALSCLIRAKGFLWLSNSDSQMFYWQLAGKHFELSVYDTWWAATEKENWPTEEEERADILKDVQGEFGDRRQVIGGVHGLCPFVAAAATRTHHSVAQQLPPTPSPFPAPPLPPLSFSPSPLPLRR